MQESRTTLGDISKYSSHNMGGGQMEFLAVAEKQ